MKNFKVYTFEQKQYYLQREVKQHFRHLNFSARVMNIAEKRRFANENSIDIQKVTALLLRSDVDAALRSNIATGITKKEGTYVYLKYACSLD